MTDDDTQIQVYPNRVDLVADKSISKPRRADTSNASDVYNLDLYDSVGDMKNIKITF